MDFGTDPIDPINPNPDTDGDGMPDEADLIPTQHPITITMV